MGEVYRGECVAAGWCTADGEGAAATGDDTLASPSKRAHHGDEGRAITWDQVQALFGLGSDEAVGGASGEQDAPILAEARSES